MLIFQVVLNTTSVVLLFFANCNFRSGRDTEIKNPKEQKGVKVVLHAILSKSFNRTQDTQIFIRGEFPIFCGWDENALKLMPVK